MPQGWRRVTKVAAYNPEITVHFCLMFIAGTFILKSLFISQLLHRNEETFSLLRIVWCSLWAWMREASACVYADVQPHASAVCVFQPFDSLPTSQTCFFQLRLPPYSSQAVMAERLRYAINNCRSIDMDNYMLSRNVDNADGSDMDYWWGAFVQRSLEQTGHFMCILCLAQVFISLWFCSFYRRENPHEECLVYFYFLTPHPIFGFLHGGLLICLLMCTADGRTAWQNAVRCVMLC